MLDDTRRPRMRSLAAVLELGAIANAHQASPLSQRNGIWHRLSFTSALCRPLRAPRPPAAGTKKPSLPRRWKSEATSRV
jgi:hypothetical protein